MSISLCAIHSGIWPKSIIYPKDYDGGESLCLDWDLGKIDDAEKKKVIKSWVSILPTLKNLSHLKLWSNVTQSLFDAICQVHRLDTLQIKRSNVKTLTAISELTAIRSLTIGSSTKVESIEPLTGLATLKLLDIENFKLIENFAPLSSMKSLEVLAVTGNMWSKQAIASLEPFGEMKWLTYLALDVSGAPNLRPLGNLKNLKALDISGRLSYEEYAWLAGKLPNTNCRWFQPYAELVASGIGRCEKCKQESMVMVTGRGKPVLCKHCEAAKLEKHVDLFNKILADARLG
jgi:hypothetical protein